jgi:glycosyltransferase involved in cell wall biosynthesis
MDRVSVVIPAFNAERTLRTTLESVLAQTHQELEVIVVDDGSTDNTENTVKDYVDQGRITYIKRENGGIAAGRNTGLLACTGDYISLLDHDDLWDPDKIEKQLERLKETGSDLVFCYPRSLKLDGKLYDPPLEKLQFHSIIGTLVRHNIIYVSSILFHKSLLERVGLLDESFRYCEDWDWALRMVSCVKMVYMPECLVTRRDQTTSFSITYSGKYNYYVKLYHKHAEWIDPSLRKEFRRNMGNKCYTDAHKLLKSGRRKEARAAYGEALKLRGMLALRLHKFAWHYVLSFW